MRDRDHVRRPPRNPESGIIWWLVVLIFVVVVIIIAGIAYVATQPHGGGTTTQKHCPGGNIDVEAYLRGAQAGGTYTVMTTANRVCDLGVNCTCGNIQGSFGTPTMPCDVYDGNVGPIMSTD